MLLFYLDVMGKRIVLTDSSINSYGYRVLTEGGRLDRFLKNPIMLYMHMRDEGSDVWGNYKAIGHWKDLKVEDDTITAEPVFDKCDELSKMVAAKFEAGTFRAASIGIKVITTSSDKSVVLPGQTRETVTEWELMEASIVDIPANGNAVRLYDNASSVALAAGMENNVVPALNQAKTMNLKKSWKTVLAFLKVGEDQAEQTELSAEQMESLNSEMNRLQGEHASLVNAKKEVDEKLATSQEEVNTLKSETETQKTEIATLKTNLATKDKEIAELKEQVQNLKNQPDEDKKVAPKNEPGGEKNDLASFCENADATDYAGLCGKLKEEGLL